MPGAGRPLDAQTRTRAERAFGLSFERVRVHDGSEAQALARAHGARAVTIGADIWFNQGFHRPSTGEGQRLLAHELAHVAQQTGSGTAPVHGVAPEVAADVAAASMLAGRDASSISRTPAPIGPQCQPLSAQEVESLDEDSVGRRLESNRQEQQVVALTDQYRAELSRERALLQTRTRQITDQADVIREVREELTEVSAMVARLATEVPGRPADHALNEVRGVGTRLAFDQEYSATVAGGLDVRGRELALMSERFGGLRVTHAATVEVAQRWHAAHPIGDSLGMTNERVGTSLAGTAERHWNAGGWYYVSGGGAYFLAFGVAFVDAGESVFSIGFHETATEVSQAYARGDISRNEGERLLWNAAWRALLIAAITRGVGAATSRIGMAGGRALGLAPGSLALAVAGRAFAGGLEAAVGLGAQHGLTVLMRNHLSSPVSQAIWETGIPTGTQWAIAIPLAMLLGGLGGARAKRIGDANLIGSTLETPGGRLRIAAITRDGSVVLQPVAASTAPPPPPPTTIDLVFNAATGVWERPAPTGGALAPVDRPGVPTSSVPGSRTPALAARTTHRPGSLPVQRLLRAPRTGGPPGAATEEVRLSQADYEAALGMVHPSQYNSWVARVVDEVGELAAQRAMKNPRFVQAIASGNWPLAGTFFHSAAAAEVRALPANALPSGWSVTAEEVIQSGAGGSRTDVFLRGPNGILLEFDWKTTGRSGLSSASRSEMAKHAGHIRANIGGSLQTQQTVSWMDYVRPLL